MISNRSISECQLSGEFLRIGKSGVRSRVFAYVTLMLAFVVIVIPNSLRPVSLPLFFISAVLALISIEWTKINTRPLVIWVSSSFITLLFVVIGVLKGYADAVAQVLFVYIISPGFWLLICYGILGLYPLISVIRAVIFFGVLGGISVFVFYYIFVNFGAESLMWLISLPNLQYGDGAAGATMHVFGSLMFISGGFFAAPQVIKQGVIKFIVAFILLAAALLSGRSALMLSFVFGLFVWLIGNSWKSAKVIVGKQIVTLIVILVSVVATIMAADFYGFNVTKIVADMMVKISEGGGEERVDQAKALVDGIQNSWLLGAGHGVGVSVIRNDEYPWRYELLWLATIFRVGLVGTIIYSIPVVVIIYKYMHLLINRRNSSVSNFIFGGFLASFIGSATNPYYESFEFQWMLVLPFVYFMLSRENIKPSTLSVFVHAKNN